MSEGQSLTNIEVKQNIWYNVHNMRKIDFLVSEEFNVRDEENYILGGTIGSDLPNIVITDRVTGNEISCQSR